MMHHATVTFFTVVAVLLTATLTPISAVDYVESIQSPNLCLQSTETLKYGTWMSYDCPINALCVPVPPISCNSSISPSATATTPCHDYGYCSCSYDEDMYEQNSQGLCVASPSTKAYATYYALLAVVSVAITVPLFRSIHESMKLRGYSKFDFVLLSGVLACISLWIQAIHRVLRVVMMLGAGDHITTRNFSGLRTAGQVLLSISYCSILAMLFVVGVGVHSFLMKSTHLQGLNVHQLKIKIGRAAIGAIMTLVGGDIILIGYSEFAIAFCFSATFILFAFLLYRRILNRVLRMEQSVTRFRKASTRNADPISFNNINAATNGHSTANTTTTTTNNNNSASSGSERIFHHIRLLSIQILFLLPLDCALCIIYTLLWYIGRLQISQAMLGPGKVAMSALHFVLTTAACFCVSKFVLNMSKLRKDKMTSSQKSFQFSMPSESHNAAGHSQATTMLTTIPSSSTLAMAQAVWVDTKHGSSNSNGNGNGNLLAVKVGGSQGALTVDDDLATVPENTVNT